MTKRRQFLAALVAKAGAENVLTDPGDCLPYGLDNSGMQGLPVAVVFATSAAQVSHIVHLCRDHQIAIVPRGRGSGTSGGAVVLGDAIVLSSERMNRILEINRADRYCRVEPGVLNGDLQSALARHGFFWPPDPSSADYCTVGGNLAYNSAGPRAVKYGTPRENTLGLSVVIGNGNILECGVRTTKGVVGYDLTRLFVGSEGTLGFITAATLRITPLAKEKRSLRALYTSIEAATQAVTRIMGQPDTPCALEFMDATCVRLLREANPDLLPARTRAILIIDLDGSPAAVDAATDRVARYAKHEDLLRLNTARNQAESQQLWSARKALSPRLREIAPGKLNEDVVVPVSRLPDLIHGLDALAQRHALCIANFGHAGNGNIHVNLLYDPADASQSAAATRCLDDVLKLVLSLGGTLSGEHGVGTQKRDFIHRELGTDVLAAMRDIKYCLDPDNIMNPGKMLPENPA